MADDQTPHSDLIDDAIRQAERQLEQKLEALRMSALGEGSEPSHGEPSHEEPARDWEQPAAAAEPGGRRDHESPTGGWQPPAEAPQRDAERDRWEDAVMRPVEGRPTPANSGSWASGGFVPDDEQQRTPSWQEPGQPAPASSYESGPRYDERMDEPPAYGAHAYGSTGFEGGSGPSEDEMQFWAQTRTALRLLQQSTDNVTREVTSNVTDQVERIVRDELSAPTAALRQVQQQLPAYAERIEHTLAEELEAPSASIRQLQEELPVHLERMERSVQQSVRANLDEVQRSFHDDVSGIERSVAENVTRMAQELGRNVSEVGHAVHETGDRVDRIDSGIDRVERSLQHGFGRVEQGLRGEFERIEYTMRGELQRVEEVVREELEAPLGSMRQLHDELPSQFHRIERVVRENGATEQLDQLAVALDDLQARQRELGSWIARSVRDEMAETRRGVRDLVELDMGGVLGELVNANRLTLDKLSSVSDGLDRDRLQRAEDLELVVDSMATGWQGLFGAVNRVLERVEHFDDRMAHLESRLGSIGTLERTVDTAVNDVRQQLMDHMQAMEHHLEALQPAPVVVTVNHPDAQVAQSTRGGFRKQEDAAPASYNET